MLTTQTNAQTTQLFNKRIATLNGSNRNQEVKEGRLIIQPELTNSSNIKTPLRTVGVKNNLVNNRLLINADKQIIVEPETKKKNYAKKTSIIQI